MHCLQVRAEPQPGSIEGGSGGKQGQEDIESGGQAGGTVKTSGGAASAGSLKTSGGQTGSQQQVRRQKAHLEH